MERAALPRLLSLDPFRGSTAAGIFLGDLPGCPDAIHAPLEYAGANG